MELFCIFLMTINQKAFINMFSELPRKPFCMSFPHFVLFPDIIHLYIESGMINVSKLFILIFN